ncbi:protein MpC2H2-26 [Marchantia polymorpha subsp. ruderalis]|uniref:G-patch domain-containing protein n=1 Tax=Marchantia polymorpha TaxID=3197 RepID=A0A2R6WCY8_MARPO|nr:hypothetical protein MARPO_0108s0049 [Marchantia polymorpha]BBN19852.1 hypothetical protein Mp_8g14220 [Marchantia polymorpha subsp. ruderalis]|eukprot:PTQ31704.1 hypothetical protein MARPO_0108s0049 [Marchantia polymorpha]
MEESRGLKTRRNYRRRHCSHGGDDEEEDEEDDDDEKDEKDEKNFGLNFESRAGEDGNLKQPSASSVIPVDEAVGAYDSALGSVDGGSLSAPPPSPPREASGAQGVGSGRNGARIASGIGFHMLRAMGWTENTGLGQSRKGMVDPILPTSKTGNLGLGFNASSTSVHDTQQEAIRHLQKAKREERDRKLKLKLEKAQEAEEDDVFMRESFIAVSANSDGHPLESSSSSFVEGATESKTPSTLSGSGLKLEEVGRCPHCRQRFESKQGLKSHVQARHAKLLRATTRRPFKKERRRKGAAEKQSGQRGAARALAPVKQDFSVYD